MYASMNSIALIASSTVEVMYVEYIWEEICQGGGDMGGNMGDKQPSSFNMYMLYTLWNLNIPPEPACGGGAWREVLLASIALS